MTGWKTKNNNSSTTGSERWRNAGPSAFQLQVMMLKSDKIWCAYLVVNCVCLQTFWKPLAQVFYFLFVLQLLPSVTQTAAISSASSSLSVSGMVPEVLLLVTTGTNYILAPVSGSRIWYRFLVHLSWALRLRYFAHLSPSFYKRVKYCKIWSNFGLWCDTVWKESNALKM